MFREREPWKPSQTAGIAAANLLVDATTARATRALERRGIPHLLIKGPSITRWLYGDNPRRYGDCDLLLPEDGIPAALEALAEIGLHLDAPGAPDLPHDHAWYSRDLRGPNLARVEIHRTFPGIAAEPGAIFEALQRGSTTITVLGQTVAIPNQAGILLLIALHAAKDGTEVPHPLIDLQRSLELAPLQLWQQAASLAGKLGAIDAFCGGLALVPEGQQMLRKLELRPGTGVDTELRLAQARGEAHALERWRRVSGPRAKLLWLVGKLFPPPAYVRSYSAVARKSSVGLALAYAYRPIRLSVGTARAIPGYVRARRKVRSISRA